MIPLSLYVHIPWCERKCPYCDFNSHTATTAVDQHAYINALLYDLERDLTFYQTQIGARQLQSIFIGGGTPSLFDSKHIHRLLACIEQLIEFAPEIEITMEANPGSAEAARFAGFKGAGVNRLSIGVQSLNDGHLRALGRVHNSTQAIAAVAHAHAAGFDNFNLDFMFGLPEQTAAQALDDIAQAIHLKPTHLSCYQLTIEPNTLFYHQPPLTPDDETLWAMQLALQAELKAAGYQQYEVSAYSRPGKQCLHNLNYWQFGDYLGIGAGAHGKLCSATGDLARYWKVKHPATYVQRSTPDQDPAGARDSVEMAQRPFEFMLNALRLSDGFDLGLFAQRTQQPVTTIDAQLTRHQELGLVEIVGSQLRPTVRGKTMIDSMLQDYLP